MSRKETNSFSDTKNTDELMPVLFVGHGSPMNAIEDNQFSKKWREVGNKLPKPKAILCISAHWETWGVLITAMEKPRTIHDFGGFPKALFEAQYPAPGSLNLATEVKDTFKKTEARLDQDWGLDHGCWSVLKQMFPSADIPVVQLSLDSAKTALEHYALAKELTSLRRKGVLIIGSGNLVHNLRMLDFKSLDSINKPFGFDWAIEANVLFKKLINENRYEELCNYQLLGESVQMAVPTPEHYLPMLYTLALKQENETIVYFNDQAVGGSITMTSMIIADKAMNAQYVRQLS